MAEVIFLNENLFSYILDDIYSSIKVDKKLYVLSVNSLNKTDYQCNQNVIDELKNNTAYLLVCNVTERLTWPNIEPIFDYLGLLSCPTDNIILTVLNTSFNINVGSLTRTHCPFKFFYFSFYYYLHTLDYLDTKINTKPEKHFTCLMRAERPIRNYFYHLMKSNQLLDKGYVTKLNTPNKHNSSINDDTFKNRLSAEEYELFLLNSKDKLEIDYDYNTRIAFNRTKIKDSSILEVALESSLELGELIPSEKTFNAFKLKKFLLVVGNYRSLEFVRKYFGFKTFPHIFDESYDNINDPIRRAEKVFEQLKWFCSLSKSELENLINDNKELLEYNHNHFYNSLDIQSSVISKIENYFNKGENNGRN